MHNIKEFRKVRFRRLCWVWGLTIATCFLFFLLLFTWGNIHWFIFPLNEFGKNICENLFFAFTTGTIMMWFQNSVDGYSQMRDSYKEIEMNTSELSVDKFWIREFIADAEKYIKRDDIEWLDTYDIFLYEVGREEYTLIYNKSERYSNREIIKDWFSYCSEIITFHAIEKQRNRYVYYLNNWVETLTNNELFYEAEGLSFDIKKTVFEMKELLEELKDWKCGYRESGKWILEDDPVIITYDRCIEDEELINIKFDKKKATFFYKCEGLSYNSQTDESFDDYGVWYEKIRNPIRKGYDFYVAETEYENYLLTPPDKHTLDSNYLAEIFVKMKVFEFDVREYNNAYRKEKSEMIELYTTNRMFGSIKR